MKLLICANAGPPAFQATSVATPSSHSCCVASPPTESPPTHAIAGG